MRNTLPSFDRRRQLDTRRADPVYRVDAGFDTDQSTSLPLEAATQSASLHAQIAQTSVRSRTLAVAGLVIGALLGMAGSFAPSAEFRGLAWTVDGVALVVASALLAIHHLRQGNEQLAAGFLVFLVGETLIVSGSAMELAASAPTFAAGAGLWSAALALVSASPVMPAFVRLTGAIAAILLAVTTARIALGSGLTPLSEPLPFFAYPFLALTLFGWAWVHRDRHRTDVANL